MSGVEGRGSGSRDQGSGIVILITPNFRSLIPDLRPSIYNMLRRIIIFAAIFIFAGAVGASSGEVSGDEFYSLGRYDDAARQYRIELNREPGSPRLLTNLGCSLYHLGRYDEALESFQNALKFKVEPPQA